MSVTQSIVCGNAMHLPFANQSVQCCITSPPYWMLREYNTATWEGGNPDCQHRVGSGVEDRLRKVVAKAGAGGTRAIGTGVSVGCDASQCKLCGAKRIDAQLGLESTPEGFVDNLVSVFAEVWRVLKDDGVLYLNLGDSYASKDMPDGTRAKSLLGMPWRVAFGLQRFGWIHRCDVTWCLSGGAQIYVRLRNGQHHIMMARSLDGMNLDGVKLWNGTKWTSLLGVSKSRRQGTELEIVLRSGERISCTPNHQFPTQRGLVEAGQLQVGDVIDHCQLPEPEEVRDCVLDEDAAWFAGLYIAEGSMAGDTIQLAGHSKEVARWEKVQQIAAKFGGSATITNDGNGQAIRVYGKILNAILSELVSGRVSHDKGFAPVVWRYSNAFIAAMVDGYLSGDGYWETKNRRWRLGFCRNYNLERDLRTACARLGYTLVLNLATVRYDGRDVPTFKGELRTVRSGHHGEIPMGRVKEIRKARCRYVYDLGVEDEPHTYALASGILTHNSKPNPRPESVTDRPTKAHEYIFMMTKQPNYYWDAKAVREPAVTPAGTACNLKNYEYDGWRNIRSVWNIPIQPNHEIHFATFPEKLAELCILSGSRPGDYVMDPFSGSGTVAVVAKRHGRGFVGTELNRDHIASAYRRIRGTMNVPLDFTSEEETVAKTPSMLNFD